MRRVHGFTLIELLTVIAIIAILSAVIFPVYARAKDSANRSSDASAMNQIRTALQLYKVDQGGYPPALLGYVGRYQSGANQGNVIPANHLTGYLYPKRIDSLETLRPAYNRAPFVEVTTAVWPNQDSRPVGSAPLLDLNGDGTPDDPAGARQLFGPDTVVRTNPANGSSAIAQFYKVSGYEVAENNFPGGKRIELRYTLFWSDFGINGGNALDDPRQLGYADPPESTVITWNGHFRDWSGGVPARGKRDLVLFLGGSVRNVDSRDMNDRSWRMMPQ